MSLFCLENISFICTITLIKQSSDFFTAALKTPLLNYTLVSSEGDIHNVNVNWTTPDSSMPDIEYVLSFYNSSRYPTQVMTTHLNHNFSLHTGVQYELTIFSQRCDGNVKSNSSKPLQIFFPGKNCSHWLNIPRERFSGVCI